MLGRHREFFKRVYNGQASALIRKRIQYYVLQRLQLEYGTDVDPAIQHFIAAGSEAFLNHTLTVRLRAAMNRLPLTWHGWLFKPKSI